MRKRFIISKITAIGDVVVALPMASFLKQIYPDCHVGFIGRTYTRPLIESYADIDTFIDGETLKASDTGRTTLKNYQADAIIHVTADKTLGILAKRANIPLRIGYLNRLHHWYTCNRRVLVRRRHTPWHEGQLDLKLLQPLGGKAYYTLKEMADAYRFKPLSLPTDIALDNTRFKLILHPKTHGQQRGYAREWPSTSFAAVLDQLDPTQFQIFITGSTEEGQQLKASLLERYPHCVDMCGKLDLSQLIHLIAHCDGLIAGSTGPLHLASALGRHALGLFPPIKPFDATRWGPIGTQAEFLMNPIDCSRCRLHFQCHCMQTITPQQIVDKITTWCAAKLISRSR